VNWVYNKFGYVKLLGLPHIIFWTPLVYYLLKTLKRGDVPVWPTRIISVILAVFVVSLVFDYVDVIRYLFGNRGVSA
jgi:hypothetical protein